MKTFSEFFGFKEDPFKRTPDVDFYYPTKMHQDVLDTLNYMLESDEPFAVVIGEPGTGKTMTIRKFISELPANIVVAYILFPSLTPAELFLAILEDFNVEHGSDISKNALFSKFRDFLIDIKQQGKKAVIIIDEAQNLPMETLEELRILSNLETEKEKLLKIVLTGQPELTVKLDSDSLRQLKQRITLYSTLSNIGEHDIKSYINSHLAKAGRGSIRVQSNVIRKIARITKGNPRLINTLMERAIIAAFLDNAYTINEDHLSSAISSVNTIMTTIRRRRSMKYVKLAVGAAAAVLCFVGGFSLFAYMEAGNKQAASTVVAKVEPAPVMPVAPVEPVTPVTPPPAPESRPVETIPATPIIDIPPTPEISETFPPITPSVIPEATPQTVPTTPVALKVVITASTLNVRSEPALDSPRITSVLRGDIFTVIEQNADWVKVPLEGGGTGWLYKRYIKTVEN